MSLHAQTPQIKIGIPDFAEIRRDLEFLMLPPPYRRKLMSRLGRMVIMHTRENMKAQRTVDGEKMASRNKNTREDGTLRDSTPMFDKMVSSRWLRVVMPDPDQAIVYFSLKKMRDSNLTVAGMAYAHDQGGKAVGMTYQAIKYPGSFPGGKSKIPTYLNKKQFVTPKGEEGCTANQAAMMYMLNSLPNHLTHTANIAGISAYASAIRRDAAYRALDGRRAVQTGLSAATRFLMMNVSRGFAAFLIEEGMKKASYQTLPVHLPARPILGLGERKQFEYAVMLMQDIYGEFKAKDYYGKV